MDKRQAQILGTKIDNMIPYLLNVAKKDFRERFKRPEKDATTGLYVENVYGGGKDLSSLFSAKS